MFGTTMEVYETLPHRSAARRRRLPAHDDAVRDRAAGLARARSSTRWRKDKRIFLAAQHDAAVDDPAPARHLHDGLRGQHRPEPEAARRQRQGAGRGRGPRRAPSSGRRTRASTASSSRCSRGTKDATGDVESAMSRVVSLFEQYVKLSNNLHYDAMIAAVRVDDPGKLADTIAAHLRRRRRREAEPARDHLAARAPEPHRRHPRGRGRQAPGRPPHPVARQEADGEGAEGVLPQREDEGDPEGAGPQGREGQRDRRAEEEDRTGAGCRRTSRRRRSRS